MAKPQLKPTAGETFRITGITRDSPWDFAAAMERSRAQESAGDIEGACNTRYEAAQMFFDIIPDDTDVNLEWEDEPSREALFLVYSSAIDHFLVGDFEMCAAMLEMVLELDPEDHLEASKRLAYAYVALEEWELFDEVINDISDKYPDKEVVALWSEFRRTGKIPEGEFIHFRKSFPAYYNEFVSDEHPVSEEYLREVESEKPSREALARELWLQTEHLWTLFPGFIDALKAKV